MIIEGREVVEELEEESERVELETHALAQWEMARSTMVEIAPSRPPNTDESELELELEDDDELLEAIEDGRVGEDGSSGDPPR